ncbi:MAG TPA: hypothetical protein VGN13_05815 [Solirubrobacteraceae bacterium]
MASCGILTASLSACQSTEQESAQIGRQSQRQAPATGALKLGARNGAVHISHVTLLAHEGRLAVAAELTSTSPRAQRDVPILVTVTGKHGETLYSNAAGGLEPSLQRIALLRAHQSAWWVDDQVLVTGAATSAHVEVGAGARVTTRSPAQPLTRAVHADSQAGVATIAATLLNSSAEALTKIAVFGVALRRGLIVAAGRAVIASLAGRASAAFQIVLVGQATGAKIALSAIPGGSGG